MTLSEETDCTEQQVSLICHSYLLMPRSMVYILCWLGVGGGAGGSFFLSFYMNKLGDLAKQTKFEGRSLSSCCGRAFKETGQNRNAQVFISYNVSSCPSWFRCLLYVANVAIGCSKCSRFQLQEN